jgi:hypothetical protein
MALFGRWAPLVGSAFLVASVTLKYFGLEDLANILSTVGGLLPAQVGADELAALLVTFGLVRKFIALVGEATGDVR